MKNCNIILRPFILNNQLFLKKELLEFLNNDKYQIQINQKQMQIIIIGNKKYIIFACFR